MSDTGGGNFFDKFGSVCRPPPDDGFAGGVGDGDGDGIFIPGISISIGFGAGVAAGTLIPGLPEGDGVGVGVGVGTLIPGMFIPVEGLDVGAAVGWGTLIPGISIFIGTAAGLAFGVPAGDFRFAFGSVFGLCFAAALVFGFAFAAGLLAFGFAFGIFIPGIPGMSWAAASSAAGPITKTDAIIKRKSPKRIFIS